MSIIRRFLGDDRVTPQPVANLHRLKSSRVGVL
jgi:hypothetical protein